MKIRSVESKSCKLHGFDLISHCSTKAIKTIRNVCIFLLNKIQTHDKKINKYER